MGSVLCGECAVVALNLGFPFRILSCSFGDFSPKLRDKIQKGKPRFEASTVVSEEAES